MTKLRRLKVQYEWEITCVDPREHYQSLEMRSLLFKTILETVPAPQFEEIDAKPFLQLVPMPLITRHGPTLRILRISDSSGFRADSRPSQPTSLVDLEDLRIACPHLTEISVGVDLQVEVIC